MKITKEKKLKNKQKLIEVAIELISKKGYKKTSMSQIAKKAKIGEATIYNYFPTKEHILYEYYYFVQIQTKEKLINIKDFNTFSLKEQIEILINTQLEILDENRQFILEIYNEIFYKNFNHPDLQKGSDALIEMVEELIDISIDAKEIESFAFNSMMKHLFSDYFFGIIYYWIHDDSEKYDNTTIMIDKSLDVIYAVLQSGLINKIGDLFSFVIKTHVLSFMKPTKIFSKKVFK